MKQIIGIFFTLFFAASVVYADNLTIKLNGKSIDLPYWASQKNSHGAVILIHGQEKSKWSEFLADLAKKFSEIGWSAVLLNCNENNSESWGKELPEVASTLRQQKNNRIIVIHYGEQLKQTLAVYSKAPKPGIEGLILLSGYDLLKSDDKKPELSIPLFDIVGQFDYQLVIDQQSVRKRAFGQDNYTPLHIPGAGHDYQYSRRSLVSFINGWMQRLAEFKLIPPVIFLSYVEPIAPLMPKLVAYDSDSDWEGYINNLSEDITQEIEPP